MHLTIDNLDGKGPRDYSPALSADGPLKIERVLNRPSRCIGELLLGGFFMPGADPGLTTPVRRARIVVANDRGETLFTGYIATEPEPVYAGFGMGGPAYRIAFTAISDEWLLDKQATILTSQGFATDATTLLGALAERTAAGVLAAPTTPTNAVGVFTPSSETATFSSTAGALASSSYTSYRAVNGALTLQPIGNTTHAIDLDDPAPGETAQPAALRTSNARELANDVTLTGETEPAAYVTELFTGDGTTSTFTLAHQPFHAAKPTLLADDFTGAALSPARWLLNDTGTHITLGTGGLALSGGAGTEGQTTLAAQDRIELAGTLILEADQVQLTAPSDGVLTGLYSGAITRATCLAGWNVTQSGGNTVLQPLVSGIVTGTSYILAPSHSYTLRIRLHTAEVQRVLQTYYARIDGALKSFGGGQINSPAQVVFELVDLGNASNTPATILYQATLATTPTTCAYAAVDSLALTGSIGAVSIKQAGSAWVTSTINGTTTTRLSGKPGTGTDYQLASTGVLTFFAGRIPQPGETLTVRYRTRQRSVARLNDPASVAAEAAGNAPGTARWLGKVVHPTARTTADCEAAAQALLALATSRAAAIAGKYTAVNPAADIWPGDVLAITRDGETLNVVVRTVTVTDGHASPELVTCSIAFANDWAESLGITLSEAVAPDADLPDTALAEPAPTLASLTGLTVVSTSTTAIQVDAGTDPPAGGGFEVRRSDANFSAKPGADLVLRSSARSFTIPRATFQEAFYIRMYDASTPPVYSRHSACILTHLAVA